MKSRSIARLLVISSAALGLAPLAGAQPGPSAPQEPGVHRMAMRGHGGMHEGMYGMEGPHGMLRGLNLTEAQRDQIFKIHHDQAPAFREQAKKVRAAHDELRKLSFADRFDEASVRKAADAQGKAIADLAVMRAQSMNRVRNVLTPEQRSQLDRMRDERRPRGPRS